MNDELQQRTDELNETNAFLESILTSIGAAVVVVDRDLQVNAWNDGAFDLWGLRGEEVLGKHLLNLDIGLPVDRLRGPIRDVLGGDGGGRAVLLPAVNRRGRSIEVQVELAPLDGREDVRGAILMMHPVEHET